MQDEESQDPFHSLLGQALFRSQSRPSGSKSVPNKNHLAFVPNKFCNNSLLIGSKPIKFETLHTVFIGIVTDEYADDMWGNDVKKWLVKFGFKPRDEPPALEQLAIEPRGEPLALVPESHRQDRDSAAGAGVLTSDPYYEIKLRAVQRMKNGKLKETDQLNAPDAIAEIERLLHDVNQLPIEGSNIRIVIMGIAFTHFMFDAITHLLKEWCYDDGSPRSNKGVQFITNGDPTGDELNFCQWLCISGICQAIEFINTRNYYPFGKCAESYSSNVRKGRQT
jgi:hypothetical protein